MFYGGQTNPPSRFLLNLPKEAIQSEDLATEYEMNLLEKLKNLEGKKNGWY